MSDLDRRGFLALAAGVCAACALGNSALAADAPATIVEVAPLADYTKGKGEQIFTTKHDFFLVRQEDNRLVAISNRCTHKRATIVPKGEGFECPKHQSQFSIHGTVIKGQAKSTLPRFGISVKDGKVVVDRSKEFSEKQFEEAGSFIEMAKA